MGNVRFYGGSKIISLNGGTSVNLLTSSEINDLFGVSNSSPSNTAVFVSNGDGNSCGLHFEGTTFFNNVWRTVFNEAAGSGTARFNYLVAYWG